MGDVGWRKELGPHLLSVDPYDALNQTPRTITLTEETLDSIDLYQTSVPTTPSPGRIYRREYESGWYVFFVVVDALNKKSCAHLPYRAVVIGRLELPEIPRRRERELAVRDVIVLAEMYRSQEMNLVHDKNCETHRRSPAIDEDCDCGLERRRSEALLEAAEKLVSEILD